MTHRPAFVVSLDLELMWGLEDKGRPRDHAAAVRGGRVALPRVLDLFAARGIHATWAVVGLLLCHDRDELLARLPRRDPDQTAPGLGPAEIRARVGLDEAEDPLHFGLSLVRRIQATPHQEVGTHTLTHFPCLDADPAAPAFAADLRAAAALHRERLGAAPRSLVFPRNQVDLACVAVAGAQGIRAWRGNPPGLAWRARPEAATVRPHLRALRLVDTYLPLSADNTWEPRPPPHPGAPVEVPASRLLRPWSRAGRLLEPLRLRHLLDELETAAATGRTWHLWLHPHNLGRDTEENLAVLDRILTRVAELREEQGLVCLTMAEAAARVAPAARRAVASAG